MATLDSLERDLTRLVTEKGEALAARRQLRDDFDDSRIDEATWTERSALVARRIDALSLMITVLELQIATAEARARGPRPPA